MLLRLPGRYRNCWSGLRGGGKVAATDSEMLVIHAGWSARWGSAGQRWLEMLQGPTVRRANLPENLLFRNWKAEEHTDAQTQVKLPKQGLKEETTWWSTAALSTWWPVWLGVKCLPGAAIPFSASPGIYCYVLTWQILTSAAPHMCVQWDAVTGKTGDTGAELLLWQTARWTILVKIWWEVAPRVILASSRREDNENGST